jgi:class 3 adenylate cyclase
MAPSDTGGSAGGNRPAPQRRRSLRAVFAADIAGFSGRMSLNETNTVNALSEIRVVGRRELKKYDGWLFGMPGDGLFATFESAVNAVQCALEMQLDLNKRPHLKDTPLRIGIHLGEVIIEDDLPYGETLNIAARLESLADPGGILVSGTVMDAVSARVSATFEDRGVPILKNIPRRIPTFAVKPPPARSPTDQTRAGLSNLDRTTRLDRNALRQILDEHMGAGSPVAAPPLGDPPISAGETSAEQVPSAPSPTDFTPTSVLTGPLAEPAAGHAPTQPSGLDTTVPLPVADPPTSQQSDAAPEQPSNNPEASTPSAPPIDLAGPRPPTLSEKLAELPTPPAVIPEPSSQPAPPVQSFAPVISKPQLEKTLPPATPLPSAPAAGARTPPSVAFLDEITKALAVHVGPFSKLIVNRELKSNPNVFELISKLVEHIPNEDERLVFRVRASHINTKS